MRPLTDFRLIIWDLDGTLWRGTLDAGASAVDPTGLHDLIPALDRLGIVNTISSNNDRHAAEQRLRDLGVLEHTVLRRIDWSSKARQVEWILSTSRFRPSQVVLVDDTDRVRAEVGRATGVETVSPVDLLLNPVHLPDSPHDLSRVGDYAVLEAVTEAKTARGLEPGSVDREFLEDSGIRVVIDSAPDVDAVSRLSMRSNQLNYTGSRLTPGEVGALLADPDRDCTAVRAVDRYGDYGLVGFRAVDGDGRLEHLFLSCRVLNMGIDSWLWSGVSFAEPTTGRTPDRLSPWWITEVPQASTDEGGPGLVTWIGGCELDIVRAMVAGGGYLDDEWSVETRGGSQVYARSSVFVMEPGPLRASRIRPPWISDDLPPRICRMRQTVVWSLWADYWSSMWRVRDGDGGDGKEFLVPVPQGGPPAGTWLSGRDAGPVDAPTFGAALDSVLEELREDQRVILVNAPEFSSGRRRETGEHVHDHHRALNAVVDGVVARHDRVELADLRPIVRGEEDLSVAEQAHLFHYGRRCYVDLADRIAELLQRVAADD
ncbi:hypothetical protein BFG51_04120 [Dietzia alimentaria]|nr:hypothetical protein BFG51_04120 [Dietzia alimentaria]